MCRFKPWFFDLIFTAAGSSSLKFVDIDLVLDVDKLVGCKTGYINLQM